MRRNPALCCLSASLMAEQSCEVPEEAPDGDLRRHELRGSGIAEFNSGLLSSVWSWPAGVGRRVEFKSRNYKRRSIAVIGLHMQMGESKWVRVGSGPARVGPRWSGWAGAGVSPIEPIGPVIHHFPVARGPVVA
jgi:hypothetical protein